MAALTLAYPRNLFYSILYSSDLFYHSHSLVECVPSRITIVLRYMALGTFKLSLRWSEGHEGLQKDLDASCNYMVA